MSHQDELPAGWAATTLGEVLPIAYGKSLTKAVRNASGEVPVFGSSGEVGKHDTPLTEGPTIIIGRKGTVGAVHYSAKPCWPIDTVYFAEGTPSRNLQFLRYMLDSLQLARLDRSTAIPGLSRDDYNVVQTILPPLPEQHRTVEAIESYLTRLNDAVATLERVQRNLKRYRASVLKAAVEGRLVPTEAELARAEGRDYEPASVLLERILKERRRRWIEEAAEKGRAKAEEKAKKAGQAWTAEDNAEALEKERAKAAKKYKEPTAPDTEGLPELPEGWCWASVDQTITIIDYRGRTPPYAEDGIPHLRSSNVRDGRIHWAGLRYVTEETFDAFMTRGLPAEGDLLFTTEAPMGEVAFVPNTRFSLAQRIMILSPARDCLRPRFLYLQIQSSAFQNRIRFRKTGSGVTGISSRNFKPAGIAIAPMSEQARIADEVESLLSNVESMAVVAETSGLRCQRLRQSILKWAFEGKLVDQDPNDEPASVLLDRIKAERAAMETTRKNNRKSSSRRKAK